MLEVAASEFDLITVARAIVGLGDPVPSLLRGECKLSGQSPACATALRETLAKGCVRRLAAGGWKVENRVRNAERVNGRLWERHPAPTLTFTSSSEQLLRWMTAESMVLTPPPLKAGPKTLGDDLFFYLSMSSAVRAHLAPTLAKQSAFQQSPLCWLGFPDQLGRFAGADVELPDFSWLADGLVVEALEVELAQRWVTMEMDKGEIIDSNEMIRVASAQTRALETYFATIDAARRRDLSRFVIEAAQELGASAPTSDRWLHSLAPTVALSSRMAAREAAASFLASIETVVSWAEAAKNAHFIDDDYAAAQILLEIWETLTPASLQALREVRKEMTSLEAITPDEPDPQGAPS